MVINYRYAKCLKGGIHSQDRGKRGENESKLCLWLLFNQKIKRLYSCGYLILHTLKVTCRCQVAVVVKQFPTNNCFDWTST